ncbi:hypothetical protein BT96DRAFT_1020243 [Gymnopus androsaceus JB14]|uniref:Uncharacterized protein n=1 Tax=Gymnopus androsaceus JB14 TaxID=1447944 RepID=A0A6A4HKL4_9AGAR|nr:hypothetical protein BT96DRAFT_1020243 [Gymnopus androsaceus JB14]
MSDLVRIARSANEWTSNELEAYNIQIAFQNAQTFFNETPLPAPSLHPEILTAQTANDTVDEASWTVLCQLELAMTSWTSAEADIIGGDTALFTVVLLRSLGYIHRPRVFRTRKELRFVTCGENKDANLDVSIIDHSVNAVILLVQEDRRLHAQMNPHHQLIAKAIAAFQDLNARRESAGLDALSSKVIPGITMVGTFPTFFKIPVTQELNRCVIGGIFPSTPTIVTGHVPVIPRPNSRFSEGMKPLDNRRIILECFEAFKKFIV